MRKTQLNTTKVPGARCTNCRRMVRAATNPFDANTPAPGDISVCLHCGHIMVFTASLQLRNPTDAEQLDIAGDPRVIAINNTRPR